MAADRRSSRTRLAATLAAALAALLAACAGPRAATSAATGGPTAPVARPASPAEAAAAEARDADRAMSAASAARDPEAFIAHVAEDALFLGARASLGRAAIGIEWSPRLAEGGPLLTWAPDRSVASGAGDLVLTGGTWRWLEAGEADPAKAGTGRYFTVWRRGADGLLRAVLDGGDRAPKPVPDRVTRRLVRSIASADGALVAEAGLLLDGEEEVGWYAVVSRGVGPDAEVLVDSARYQPAR